jgi:hypothetical protein
LAFGKIKAMKTNSVFIILLVFLLQSCYSTKITPVFLTPENQNKAFFSQLDVQFDDQSFASVFAPSQKIVDSEVFEGEFESRREVQLVNESRNSLDVKNLIEKFAVQREPGQECCNGTAVFSITFYDFKESHLLPYLSTFTFGVLNLAGLPSNHVVQTIELKVSVFDKTGKLVKSYLGFGRDKYLAGLYYHNPNQQRPSFIKSVKNALSEIDKQMAGDNQLLSVNFQ